MLVVSRSCMSQVSILGRAMVEVLFGHRGVLCACCCFLARRSRAISPCSLNGAAVAVLIGNRVGGRLGVTGRSDDRGSCASPPRSDTARYPSWVVPRSGGRSQGTSTIQHYQWSPVTAVLVAGLAAADDAGRAPPQLVCPDGLPRRVGDVRARRLAARTPCLVSARQTVLTCQGPTR